MVNISSIKKGGLRLPLFFLGASLCLLRASHSADAIFWWPGLCFLAALAWLNQQQCLALSWLSAVLAGFCLVLLVNALYLSPTYHPSGIYCPATLMIAFVAGSRHPDWLVQTGFKLFCTTITLIAVWALLQWLTGRGFVDATSPRPLAVFATPNNLATAVNLALVPVLGFYLLGFGDRATFGLLLLFAALLTTQSRGGYLGLLAGILFLPIFAGHLAVIAQLRRYCAVALGFLMVLGLFWLYARLGTAKWSLDGVAATLSHGDSSNRLEIYQIAWHGLSDHFWLGMGFQNFVYYFEMHKPPFFADRHMAFVHNDYLQLAFDTGMLGLALFLLLIISVYGQLFKFRRQVIVRQHLPLILSAMAVTSMLVHALVDYPFHIPFLLAVFGVYLAIINRQLINMGAVHWLSPRIPEQSLLGLRPVFFTRLLVVVVMAWLALPAVAEVSADYGTRRLLQGDGQNGLFWHSVARLLQPRNANYYWQEGIIWRDLGLVQMRPELVEKSIAVFSDGIAVNPFEVNNLLEKIAIYRKHGTLLKHPASHQELMVWINQARSLQPYSEAVQVEYVRCLEFIGEHALAIEQANALKNSRPQSQTAQKLLESIVHE
jgi:O-antigen ligase